MHQKRLAAGLRPDPLGELTVLPQTHYLDLKGRGRTRTREGKGKRTDGRERGGRGDKGRTGRTRGESGG